MGNSSPRWWLYRLKTCCLLNIFNLSCLLRFPSKKVLFQRSGGYRSLIFSLGFLLTASIIATASSIPRIVTSPYFGCVIGRKKLSSSQIALNLRTHAQNRLYFHKAQVFHGIFDQRQLLFSLSDN